MHICRSLLICVLALSLPALAATSNLVEFPTLSASTIQKLLTTSDEFSVFVEGGDHPAKTADERVRYIANDNTLWITKSGWNIFYWYPQLAWSKKVVTADDISRIAGKLVETNFYKTERAKQADGSAYKIGVEIINSGKKYQWHWPVMRGTLPEGKLSKLYGFLQIWFYLNSENSEHWIFQPEGQVFAELDCKSLEEDGSIKVKYSNRGSQSVRIRPLFSINTGGNVVQRADTSIPLKLIPENLKSVELGGSGPAENRIKEFSLQIDLEKLPPDAKSPVNFQFSLPDAVETTVPFSKPSILVASPACPLNRKSSSGKSKLMVDSTIDQKDAEFLKMLSAGQRDALAKEYKNFKVLNVCKGNLSGKHDGDIALVLLNRNIANPKDKHAIERVALVTTSEGLTFSKIPHGSSQWLDWQYSFNGTRFDGEIKCTHPGKDKDINSGQALTDLKKAGLQDRTSICFPTHDTYNNWDCFIFKDRQSGLILWYQQAGAD